MAIPAIVLCSWVQEPGDLPWGGVGYGIVAGLGFGGYTVIIDQTSEASALLPLVTARASTMIVILIVAAAGVWRVVRFPSMPRRIVIGNGLLDVGGNVALLAGLRLGTLALVGVAASLYPAVTVVMARYVNGEAIAARQFTGLVLSLLAIGLIVVGSA